MTKEPIYLPPGCLQGDITVQTLPQGILRNTGLFLRICGIMSQRHLTSVDSQPSFQVQPTVCGEKEAARSRIRAPHDQMILCRESTRSERAKPFVSGGYLHVAHAARVVRVIVIACVLRRRARARRNLQVGGGLSCAFATSHRLLGRERSRSRRWILSAQDASV